MNLELNLFQNLAGGMSTAPAFARNLTREDKLLEDVVTPKAEIKALRARHHSAARLIAGGNKVEEVAAITGYTRNTLNVLLGDPTFQELCAHYAVADADTYISTNARLAALANDALAVLQDRIETQDEKFRTGELIEIAKLGADRTGHGPSSTQNTNINVGFAERLQLARERTAAAKLIDGEVNHA